MATPNSQPYIPTGYEGQLSEIARKRKLAEALTQASLSGGPHKSYLGAFGDIAEAIAGRVISKKADKKEGEINERRSADQQVAMEQLQADVASGADIGTLAAKYGSDPRFANSKIVEALAEAYKARMVNQQEVTGGPMEMKDPTGNFVTGTMTKAGQFNPMAGGMQLPPKMENVNGVATALQRQAPGAVLPQNLEQLVIRGADGNPVINEQLAGVKKDIAVAGKSVSTNNTFVNTGENAYAKGIGTDLATQDSAAISAARTAPQQYAEAQRVKDLIEKNKVILGTAAGARLAAASMLDTLGITRNPKVADTQTLMSTLASQTLENTKSSGLGTGNGFTDKDREFLQNAKAGTINLSGAALIRLANLNQRAARVAQTRGQEVIKRMQRNPATSNMVQGFDQELSGNKLPPETTAPAMTPGQRAAAILARRRAGGK